MQRGAEDASVLSSITGGTFADNSNGAEELGNDSSASALEFFKSPKLFGRSNESNQLIKSFEAVVQNHAAQVVVVHGKSGMGKTALVEESLCKKVCEQGYFCA
jgi:putative ribosome biogenesis GTPase RsgA